MKNKLNYNHNLNNFTKYYIIMNNTLNRNHYLNKYNNCYIINNNKLNCNHYLNKHNKFCFRDIHPLNKTYYWTKEECEKAKLRAYKLLKDRIGLDKLKKMNEHKKLIEIHKIDKRIPNVIMYYP